MSNAIQKSYKTIYELPSQVRTSLDETDQKKWMDAYNSALGDKNSEDAINQAKIDAWMSVVDAPSSLAVETWGSVEVRDADGELVPVKTIEDYADKFIEAGGLLHDSHSNVPVGTVWNWEVRKHPETGQDGIVFYFNVYRDGEVFERARDDILSGRKQAVSIGAEAPRGGYKCDDRGCYVERDVTDLYELSICETPANPEAYFINVGKDIAKAKQPMKGEQIRFGIKDVVVHQDYTTCPLQKSKKELRDAGFINVHIKSNGIVVAKSAKNEYKLFKTISQLGYPFRYDLQKQQFEIIPDYGVEQAIEEALENGWAHEDNIGHVTLTRDIPKEIFIDWFDRGFIVKIGDNYCLKDDDVAKSEDDDLIFYLEELSNELNSNGEEDLADMVDDEINAIKFGDFESVRRTIGIVEDKCKTLKEANMCDDVIDQLDDLGKSAKKKVKKDGGAMGVSSAGATNPVYGSKPVSLVIPTGDKKYGKRRKAKKEMDDSRNIHGPSPSGKMQKRWGLFTPWDGIEMNDGKPMVFDNQEDGLRELDECPDGWFLTEIDENNVPLFDKKIRASSKKSKKE